MIKLSYEEFKLASEKEIYKSSSLYSNIASFFSVYKNEAEDYLVEGLSENIQSSSTLAILRSFHIYDSKDSTLSDIRNHILVLDQKYFDIEDKKSILKYINKFAEEHFIQDEYSNYFLVYDSTQGFTYEQVYEKVNSVMLTLGMDLEQGLINTNSEYNSGKLHRHLVETELKKHEKIGYVTIDLTADMEKLDIMILNKDYNTFSELERIFNKIGEHGVKGLLYSHHKSKYYSSICSYANYLYGTEYIVLEEEIIRTNNQIASYYFHDSMLVEDKLKYLMTMPNEFYKETEFVTFLIFMKYKEIKTNLIGFKVKKEYQDQDDIGEVIRADEEVLNISIKPVLGDDSGYKIMSIVDYFDLKNYNSRINGNVHHLLSTLQELSKSNRDIFIQDCLILKKNDTGEFYLFYCNDIGFDNKVILYNSALKYAKDYTLTLEDLYGYVPVLTHAEKGVLAKVYKQIRGTDIRLKKFSTVSRCYSLFQFYIEIIGFNRANDMLDGVVLSAIPEYFVDCNLSDTPLVYKNPIKGLGIRKDKYWKFINVFGNRFISESLKISVGETDLYKQR